MILTGSLPAAKFSWVKMPSSSQRLVGLEELNLRTNQQRLVKLSDLQPTAVG
ncbi:MAG: hypothetical protein MUE44_32100 [Oscillatoriaceae cyanobacterium Prado104]|nr:hypothetical protein [Oscillatoriaceae cyanobacterium Prado104]